jgi:hypothetical protein
MREAAVRLAIVLMALAVASCGLKGGDGDADLPRQPHETVSTPDLSTRDLPVGQELIEETSEEPEVLQEVVDAAQPTGPWEVPLGPEDATFLVGPYLGYTTQTSVAISWETAAEGDATVEYGRTSDYGERYLTSVGTRHHAVLKDLEPGTVYHYRVCSNEGCTRDLTFATAPGPGRPFRFTVYGDSRSDPPMHRTVVESMLRDRPALVFNTGDIVADGDQPHEYREMHFDPLRPLGHYVPVYVAIGNHEWKGETLTEAKNFRDVLMFPEDPGVPIPKLSYSVTYGDAFFLVLDNTLDGLQFFQPIGAPPGPPLWVWLNEQAASDAAQQARWRFAFFHYPPGSPCHEDWGMIVATRQHVIPLLREHGFHAVFTGHVHAYERHDYDGLPVFVTGGGGAGLQSDHRCVFDSPTLVHRQTLHHHLTVELGQEHADIKAVTTEGEVFDSLSL